jgi:hypothetical protein
MRLKLMLICLAMIAPIDRVVAQSCCTPATTLSHHRAAILNGEIVGGDDHRLLEFLTRYPDTKIVMLDSPGGLLITGLAIGRIIHSMGLQTVWRATINASLLAP